MTESVRPGVSVVVLTYNEERNLSACLSSVLPWAAAVFVVDSGSTDRTIAIASRAGAQVVAHPFETHARQWAWALEHLPIATDWVLGLDADQRVTPALADAIGEATGPGSGGHAGYYVNRRQVFRGRWIRHGGYYPKYLLKLFRRGRVSLDPNELVDHHFEVDGTCGYLSGDLVEDNQNEARIADWIAKHNRYALAMAREERRRILERTPRKRGIGTADERTGWMKSAWARMPKYWRPLGYFLYRYVIRLGFLDGREGFIFHFMQAYWYRLLVDINLDELAQARPAEEPGQGSSLEQAGRPIDSTSVEVR
ncbi:MAG: glycosyltransferase family 2 protein [Acidobacteriota bacterium]